MNVARDSPFYVLIRFVKDSYSLIMILFFLLSSLLQQSNDGAFEVYVNEQLVFSKLSTGRFPTEYVLIRLFYYM